MVDSRFLSAGIACRPLPPRALDSTSSHSLRLRVASRRSSLSFASNVLRRFSSSRVCSVISPLAVPFARAVDFADEPFLTVLGKRQEMSAKTTVAEPRVNARDSGGSMSKGGSGCAESSHLKCQSSGLLETDTRLT